MINVGLIGVGRIGKQIARMIGLDQTLNLVFVADINPDPKNIEYIIRYDTTYGKFENCHLTADGKMQIGLQEATLFCDKAIQELPISDVDIVIDATGVKTHLSFYKSIIDGIDTRFLITNSDAGADFYACLGVNEESILASHRIISAGICDSTAIAPILKVIRSKYSIQAGSVTTVHPWLNYQNLNDGMSASWSLPGTVHDHFALGRASVSNLIPKPTSAIDAVGKVLPDLATNISSFSYRVPTAVVGSADCTFFLNEDITVPEVHELFAKFEASQNHDIVQQVTEPLVSSDFIGARYSALLDTRWTIAEKKLLKLVLWYDNEFGFSSRVVDQVKYLGRR